MDVTRHIAAPADIVWPLLAQTRHWPAWGPSVRAVEPADASVEAGLSGRVQTAAGVWLPFEVTEVVPGRSWRWQVVGVPATGHRVEQHGAGSAVTFEVPGWAAPYALVCQVALRRIERLAKP